ncbi:MAG: hypothetical protein OEW15_17950 [Nitrospirota bacterium]|nr:hypothetical protein [Nitrospirota bacterium]
MPFPFSIKGKFKLTNENIKPVSLRDMIANSLTEQEYSVHVENLKIVISRDLKWFSSGEDDLSGFMSGEISLHPDEKTIIVKYSFSMVPSMIVAVISIGLLFIFYIKKPSVASPEGLINLAILGCIWYCGSYILAAMMTPRQIRKFVEKCARRSLESN